MKRERWLELSPLLDRVLDLPPGERADFLAGLRASSPELTADLDRLLAGDGHDPAFLDGAPPLPPVTLVGRPIGPYVLERPIGAGGMGSVWRARRNDGRFEGAVAIKLLNAALLESGGEERFRREGTILARLSHPHIARLLDAGVTAFGQPYLVLELVDGEPIDHYADARGLDVAARLRLFLDVLEAVAHAHANLVVHRDIKPSNVLVSTTGEVKLLDFGIARLLAEEPSGAPTALTREAGRPLTPEYAAPEQVTGGPITTATDVYALGILLYVLLAGRHPNAGAIGASASEVELLRAIVERDPQRLSAVVAAERTRAPGAADETAAQRATTPERLRRLLAGDLDTIVAKALKKRPEERYASVVALADDLRRVLDHRPIAARPDSAFYRTARFVRRHRLPVALAAAALVALAAGLLGTISQARRAERQAALAAEDRDFAMSELRRSQALHELDTFLLSDAASGGGTFTAGELLDRAEAMVTRSRREDPETRVELLIAVGRQLESLDEIDRARALIDEAFRLSRGSSDPATRARAICALASSVSLAGDAARAEELARSGLAELPDTPRYALVRTFCLLRASEVARDADHPALAIARAEEAQRSLLASGLGSELLALRVAMDVAEAHRTAGDERGAELAFTAAWRDLESLGLAETETAGTLLNNWGLVVNGLGRPLEAEELFRKAITLSDVAGNEGAVSPMLRINLCRALLELGRLVEADDSCGRGYAEAKRTGDEVAVTFALFAWSLVETRAGRLDHAGALLDELDRRIRPLPEEHHYHGAFASQRGLLAHARGDLPRARAALDRAIARIDATPQRAYGLPGSLLRRSAVALEQGEAGRALADAGQALELERSNAGADAVSFRIGRAHVAIGHALAALGRRAEAAVEFSAGAAQLAPTLGAQHGETIQARRLAASPPSP
jgi:serine/threonine-protein kinase